MRKVPRPTTMTLPMIYSKLTELCDATSQETERAADAVELTLPDNFEETRALDLTAPVTVDHLAALVATFVLDLQRRGSNRKVPNV